MLLKLINTFLSFLLGLLLTSFLDKNLSKFFSSNEKNKVQISKNEKEKNQKSNNSSSPFIIVVGVGGVGSHVVMSLIRSGIKKIRVIDYDIVTLSSINRHAFALRSDVGKLKTRLIIEYVKKINNNIFIEGIEDAFLEENFDYFIKRDNPDYVIDCIDDLKSKIDLIHFCQINNIKIISSMGAAGKTDVTLLRYCPFNLLQGDTMGRRLRYQFKKKFPNESLPSNLCIYSLEKNEKSLSELDESKKDNIENYRINFNERVRTLPVFACLPAAFGQLICSVVLGEIIGYLNINDIILKEKNNEDEKVNTPLIGNIKIDKLIEDYKNYEIVKRGFDEKKLFLVYDDYLNVAKAFNFCSSISCKSGNKMRFMRWRPFNPPSKDNLVIMNKSEVHSLYNVKNEEDLINTFGKENVERIDNIIKNQIKI